MVLLVGGGGGEGEGGRGVMVMEGCFGSVDVDVGIRCLAGSISMAGAMLCFRRSKVRDRVVLCVSNPAVQCRRPQLLINRDGI